LYNLHMVIMTRVTYLVFCLSVVVQVSVIWATCPTMFGYINPESFDPTQYHQVGPNLYLDQHNELVLTDSRLVQVANFTWIQGVSYSYYGDPICIAVIDCGAAGDRIVNVTITNVRSKRIFQGIELQEICSNPGVFYGCVDTAFIPESAQEAIPPGFVVGEFGDELVISYTSSEPLQGSRQTFTQSIWLSCKELQFWDYEMISTLMLEDSLSRNIRKLTTLKDKIVLLQNQLFSNPEGTCEDIGMKIDLAPAAMESFEFLECVMDRYTESLQFLTEVTQYNQIQTTLPLGS